MEGVLEGTGDGGNVRGDGGWRECERGQGGQGMEGMSEGTGGGGSVRGDREDRGWRECQRGRGVEGV